MAALVDCHPVFFFLLCCHFCPTPSYSIKRREDFLLCRFVKKHSLNYKCIERSLFNSLSGTRGRWCVMEIHSFETTCCTFACDAFVWKCVFVLILLSKKKKKKASHVTILSPAELVQWTVNEIRLVFFVYIGCVFFLTASSHTSVHPLNFLRPNFNASHGKCWLVFYFLAPSSGHLVRRVVWWVGELGGWEAAKCHTHSLRLMSAS